jgi:hypothetical protein
MICTCTDVFLRQFKFLVCLNIIDKWNLAMEIAE